MPDISQVAHNSGKQMKLCHKICFLNPLTEFCISILCPLQSLRTIIWPSVLAKNHYKRAKLAFLGIERRANKKVLPKVFTKGLKMETEHVEKALK